MRHNQNARRPQRGRGNGGGHGGGNSHHHNNSGQQNGRRVNPRVQTFDSNGPEVRIRGTAYQINEKYLALARDAASAGDRILAESYLQHAEHYQRFINEMTEEYNLYQQQNPQHNQQPHQQHHQQHGQQQQPQADGAAAPVVDGGASADPMNDLDQGFLVGPRGNSNGHAPQANGHDAGAQPVVEQQPRAPREPRQPRRVAEGEAG